MNVFWRWNHAENKLCVIGLYGQPTNHYVQQVESRQSGALLYQTVKDGTILETYISLVDAKVALAKALEDI